MRAPVTSVPPALPGDRADRVEAVLEVVDSVPPGRVTTYGGIAGVVPGTGPRWVGRVLAEHGAAVPWWRVVRSDGTLPRSHRPEALRHYRDEATPLRDGGRVDMVAAYWSPEPPADHPPRRGGGPDAGR